MKQIGKNVSIEESLLDSLFEKFLRAKDSALWSDKYSPKNIGDLFNS